jgi:CxxC-x17-CxxC domain-containing protein
MGYGNDRNSGGYGGRSGGRSGGGRGGYGGGRSGGGNYGGRGGSYGNRDEKPEMHSADCHTCGDQCRVPFKPNGRKPVFCSDCFSKESNAANAKGGSNGGRLDFDRPASFEVKPAYKSTPRTSDDRIATEMKNLNKTMSEILKTLQGFGEMLAAEEEYEEDEEGEEMTDEEMVEIIETDDAMEEDEA